MDDGDWISTSLPSIPCMYIKLILRTEQVSATFQQPLCPQVLNIIQKTALAALYLASYPEV